MHIAFFEIQFHRRNNWITLTSKSAKFRVLAEKCLGNPNKTVFRKNAICISRFRSSLLFETKSRSLSLRQSEKSAPYEHHHFRDSFINNSLKENCYEPKICKKSS